MVLLGLSKSSVAVSVGRFHFLVRLRVLDSAIKAVPHSFLFDCLLAVLIPPGVAVRAWSATAGGGDSYPCRCQNGGDYLTVDLLDVGLAYVDILGSQQTPKQVPVRLVLIILGYRSRTPYLSCTAHTDDDGQVVGGE